MPTDLAKKENTEKTENKVEIGVCAHCGCIIFEDDPFKYDHDGQLICEDCVDEDYCTCDDCGDLYLTSDIEIVNPGLPGQQKVCPNCAGNDMYYRCDDCGELFTEGRITYLDNERNEYICDRCSHRYAQCADCRSICSPDDGEFINDTFYCVDCADNHVSDYGYFIHEYNFKPSPIFHKAFDDQLNASKTSEPLFMGVELEIDHGNDVESCSNDLYALNNNEADFYQKHDGSLDEGIEIVSHPCTLSYHMNLFPWPSIIEIARNYDFESHDAGTCGLHVHVNRSALGDNYDQRDATIAKIVVLVDRFWEQLIVFSRRDIGQLNRWASKPDVNIKSTDSETTAIQKTKDKSYDRYRAVNLCNKSTIEFRMFRGTLKLSTIYATLQLVHNICRFAKNQSISRCMNVPWKTLCQLGKYSELTQYLKDLHL